MTTDTTTGEPTAAELDALAELVLAQDPPEDHESREPWRVTDDEQAAWALRKVRAARTERARIAELAQSELDRITEWAIREDAGPARDEAYFTERLGRYAREQRDAGRKKVSTPHGDVKTLPGRLSLKVDDPDAAIAFFKAKGLDFFKSETTTSVLIGDLKKQVVAEGDDVFWPQSGEQIPGIRAEWSATSVKLDPAAGADPADAGEYTEAGAE